MAEQLKNTLSLVNLAPGASIVLPHSLKDAGVRPLAPDIILTLRTTSSLVHCLY